jgi:hypothetical protein
MRRRYLLGSLPLLALARPALADVVWPALIVESRILSWWVIGFGLIVEFFFVRWLFSLPWSRAALATVTANAVSAILGIPLIPLSGIIWELFPGSIYMALLKWGTFNPITWTATFLLSCLITTAIEALVYKKAFRLTVRRREFSWLFVANAISVGAAFVSLWFHPPRF